MRTVGARLLGRKASRLACMCVMACALLPAAALGSPSANSGARFEIVPNSFHMVPSTLQAGAHEDLTTSFDFVHNAKNETTGDVRNIVTNLPAGFTASDTAVPACTEAQLLTSLSFADLGIPVCPPASAVGTISLDFAGKRYTVPIYNLQVYSRGVTARLGFLILTSAITLTVSVRPETVGLTVTAKDVEPVGNIHDISVKIWGVPASHEHDLERQQTCQGTIGAEQACTNWLGGPVAAGIPAKPFLSNPTSCTTFTATVAADSWEEPFGDNLSEWPGASDEIGPVTGCERLHFSPSIEAHLTSESAESPTGLNFDLDFLQEWSNPETLATANLKDATVTLPEGVTINPSAGSGLAACSREQYAHETYSSLPGEGCPEQSKIGSIEIETPLLDEKIDGAIYVATPYVNVPSFGDAEHPEGSLLALYVVAKDPQRGILVKVAGKLEPDLQTGRLVTTFLDNPQQPFSRFTLKFRPGATAPLVSPPACGGYAAQARLTPWSAPGSPLTVASEPFVIDKGVHEGACPSGGTPPFRPGVIAGTDNNAAGSYSPFYLRITREDGEQEITRFSTVMPPGVTGNLTGIPFCPDGAIEAARSKNGRRELAEPSCPAASKVGHSIVGAGVGSVLAQTPGSLYLAGPYHGASLSLVSITSATVGPFDLGTVVIRFALRINPVTGQVEVDAAGSDPIPHIIRGIVVHVRDIRAYVDRPGFIINPTSCARLGVANTIAGAGANPSSPADQVPVNVTSTFQAADCQNLTFRPRFTASVTGKASRHDGVGLKVKLTYPNQPQGTQANIHYVKVDLPKQLPSRLPTLNKACPSSTFQADPAICPPASRVGTAKAATPILPVPLEGPAYFVSYGNLKFPELIVVLQGYGVTIDLHGETFINNKTAVTSSTFRAVPDEPVSAFELTLPQGPYSALAAPGGLCNGKALHMPTTFIAQNGHVIKQSTPITVTGCPRHKTKHGKPHRRLDKHKKKK